MDCFRVETHLVFRVVKAKGESGLGSYAFLLFVGLEGK